MICRGVFSPKLMHTRARTPHKGVPTAHCTCSRSEAPRNILKYKNKVNCLFFDQVNNYSNFRRLNQATWPPSTDLSTIIVDKYASACRTRAYMRDIAVNIPIGYYARPGFRCWPNWPGRKSLRGIKAWRCASSELVDSAATHISRFL